MFDKASKYSFSLDKDKQKALRCGLLLYYLESYVNGAIIEMRRLTRIRQEISKDVQKSLDFSIKQKNFHLTYLAKDTHFYFICIDKVYKLLTALSDELNNDSDIKKLARRLKKTFNIKLVRNHLEHIDKRCLGYPTLEDERKKQRKPISDFGNFIGDDFSFLGVKFPSGKHSLIELKSLYIELLKILEEKYASQDPAFVWRKQSEQRYKQIMKMLEKNKLFQN